MSKWIISALVLVASVGFSDPYTAGKNIFAQKCSGCHVGYIAADKIKENFFVKHNTVYMLSSPTVNMLAYAITRSPRHIGDPADPEMQQAEIEEYLTGALYHPKRENSICDPDIMKFYDEKTPFPETLSKKDIASLARFFMDYQKHHRKRTPPTTKMFNQQYSAVKIMKEAKAEHKRIIIEASSSHCPWCKKMKQEVMGTDAVQAILRAGYIFTEVNIDLKKKFKQITPTFFILESDGTLIARFPGALSKKDFISVLNEYNPRK